MKLLSLTQGKFAMVDDEDFDRLNAFKWCAQKRANGLYHAARYDGKKYVYMHRLLVDAPPGTEVHHINGDGLDNRRDNLKVVSRSEHRRLDVRLRRDNNSGFRGVWRHSQTLQWCAELMHHGHKHCVGCYEFKEDAARARDVRARELGWPEDTMNFPRCSK